MIERVSVATSYEYIPGAKGEVSYASFGINKKSDGNVREQLVSEILREIYGDVIADLEAATSLESLKPLLIKLKSLVGEEVVESPVEVELPSQGDVEAAFDLQTKLGEPGWEDAGAVPLNIIDANDNLKVEESAQPTKPKRVPKVVESVKVDETKAEELVPTAAGETTEVIAREPTATE